MALIPLYIRERAVEMWRDGFTQRQIAKDLKISRCALQNIIKKIKTNRGIQDLPRSGRPSKVTRRDINKMVIHSKKTPKATANEIRYSCNLADKISTNTAKRILRQSNLFGRIAAKKPRLTASQKGKRNEWCRHRRNWSHNEWSRVIFSDESKIEICPRHREYVRRPINTRFNQKYLAGTTKFGISIMLWGAIRSDGKRVLVRLDGNIDSLAYQRVIEENLFKIYNSRFIFQQDGASCHTSASTSQYFTQKGVRMLRFHTQSYTVGHKILWWQYKVLN